MFQHWIPAVWEVLGKDQSDVDLWVNEMGYADYRFRPNQASVYGIDVFHPYEHTPAYQAEMLFKFETMALASEHVSLTGWYRIDDFSPAETRLGNDQANDHLGLLDDHGRSKPDLSAFEFFHQLLGGPVRRVESRVEKSPGSQSVVNVFQSQNGKVVVSAWLRSSLASELASRTGMVPDTRSERLTVELPCARPILEGSFDPEGRPVNSPARIVDQTLDGIRLRGGGIFIAEAACGKQ